MERKREIKRNCLKRDKFVDRVASRLMELDYYLGEQVINNVITSIIETYFDAIVENESVELRGFGQIRANLMKAKIIKHPGTREEALSPPYYRMCFIPSIRLRNLLKRRAQRAARMQ